MLGLQVNPAKCEVAVLGPPGTDAGDEAIRIVRQVLPDIGHTPLTELTLLGAPLQDEGVRAALAAAAETVVRLCDRLEPLGAHTAVFFLTHHVSAPRLMHLLRSAPVYRRRVVTQHRRARALYPCDSHECRCNWRRLAASVAAGTTRWAWRPAGGGARAAMLPGIVNSRAANH